MKAVGALSVLAATEGGGIGIPKPSPILVQGRLGVRSGSFATFETGFGASSFVG